MERHQWLELTFRPSMSTCICDLWLEDADGPDKSMNSQYLTWDISEAYSHCMYPNGVLLLNTTPDPLLDTDQSDLETDLPKDP